MKRLAMVFAVLLSACAPEELEMVRGDDPIPGWACGDLTIGLSCSRDDNMPGVCAGPRLCLIECEATVDCEYEGLACEAGLCRK